ncbi:PTS glucitol/sorbitol transporter subunit IIA [Faecalicoccus pleomorphus]|uniref:PTS glucitol/sorbitol transporter subunit IIA n=1 Tax=Faecalicoccus pleomorphus TaxID=1323 RepID=UPI00156B94EA|nr:PTS glucitol/sorbitol transporter subunit IIA [Faecalicoccus pleomorphus]
MKFQATITGWGQMATDFLNPDCNFIIIFNEDAPPELAEISVLHTKSEVTEEPKKGDLMTVCNKNYIITDVGWEAIMTLRELGHCTVSFNGAEKAPRPGMIELAGLPFTAEDLHLNGKLEIKEL